MKKIRNIVLSKKSLDRWKNFDFENLKGSYASTFYTGLKKIYAANSLKEQKAIAKEYFTGKESATQKDFYDLWNTTLEEWLHSSEVGSKEFNSKADYILKLKKANAAIGTTGERIMAPGGYVYLPGSIMDGKVKFEHLKSSSEQSFESLDLILNNQWSKKGVEALMGDVKFPVGKFVNLVETSQYNKVRLMLEDAIDYYKDLILKGAETHHLRRFKNLEKVYSIFMDQFTNYLDGKTTRIFQQTRDFE